MKKVSEPCPHCRSMITVLVGQYTKIGYCPGCKVKVQSIVDKQSGKSK